MNLLEKEFLPDVIELISKFQDKFEFIDMSISDYLNEGFRIRIKIIITLKTTECVFEHGSASIVILNDNTMLVDRGYLRDIEFLLNVIN